MVVQPLVGARERDRFERKPGSVGGGPRALERRGEVESWSGEK